jgi:hypothetical protein
VNRAVKPFSASTPDCTGAVRYNPRPKEVLKVKISALAGVLICFLAAPETTKCQQEFKGLQRVEIVVEDLNKVSESMGLNHESLKDQILVALKRDIAKLKIGEASSSPSSWVYLRITSFQTATNWVATCVQVSLRRPARIIGDDGAQYLAIVTTWEKETIIHDSIDQMPSRIRDQISEAVTALAAEYYKQNP